MSRASHKRFLKKLHAELKVKSRDYRVSHANKQAHVLDVSVPVLREQVILELNHRGLSLNAEDEIAIKQYAENVVQKLKTKASIESDKYTKVRERDDSITINFYEDPGVKSIYGRVVTFYSRILNEEFETLKTALTKKIPLKNKGQIVKDQEETSANSINHAGHAKRGGGVAETQVRDALNAAMNAVVVRSTSGKALSRRVIMNDMKRLGIDLSMMRKDKQNTIFLFLESGEQNEIDGRFSGANKTKLTNQIESALVKLDSKEPIPNLRGSDSYIDKLKKGLLEITIEYFQGKKRFKVTIESTKLKPSSTAKETIKSSAKASFGKTKVPVKKLKKATKPKKGVMPDIRSFIGILNSRINTQVAKNMGSPRLNYRTGRFAESVRVTDIIHTPTGLPSIGYTYMRQPYEVFEYPGSGHPLAQEGQRDPRSLIDKSIREIMAQYAIGRFYTRRV